MATPVRVLGRTRILDMDCLVCLGKGGSQLVLDDCIRHQGKAHYQ